MAKILIVDDSSLSRRIMRRILEAAGHQVKEAKDGIAALKQYPLGKPDLVLLDLTMPNMPGLDVLKKLRQMDPAARVVIVTADIQRSSQEMAAEAGAAGFVTKPLTPDQVLNAVDAALTTW